MNEEITDFIQHERLIDKASAYVVRFLIVYTIHAHCLVSRGTKYSRVWYRNYDCRLLKPLNVAQSQ